MAKGKPVEIRWPKSVAADAAGIVRSNHRSFESYFS